MIIPNPLQHDWKSWSETLIGFNDALKNQLYVVPESHWKALGARLNLVVPTAPRAEFHKDWRDWARALQMAIGE